MKENTRFLIVCTGHNCAPFIARCVDSIKKQTYDNYDYVIVDDASTDNSMELLYNLVPHDKLISLNTRMGTVKAHDIGIRSFAVTGGEVVVWLDLDDQLLQCALHKAAEAYQEDSAVWLTYGNYIDHDGLVCFNKYTINFPDEVHEANAYRQADWKYVHLRTFKLALYMQLTDADLYLPDYIKAYIDYNIWICLMELAGKDHMRGIVDVLYYYNNMNPSNLLRSYAPNQLDMEREFCKKITPKQKLEIL